MAYVRTTLIAALVAVVFYASGFLVVFTPLPLLYAYIMKGRSSFALSTLVGFACVVVLQLLLQSKAGATASAYFSLPSQGLGEGVAGLAPVVAGLVHFLYFAVISFGLGEGSRKKLGLMDSCSLALIFALAVVVGSVVTAFATSGYQVITMMKDVITGVADEMIAINAKAGVQSAYLNVLIEKKEAIVSFFLGIMPSIIFAMTSFIVAINFVVARRMLRKKRPFSHVHNAARFRLPDGFVWFVIASGALFFVNTYTVKSEIATIVAANGAIISLSAYFLQGMAVTAYLLQQVKAPFLRTLLYLMIIMFFQTISLMIVALGVADVWADFRMRSWKARHHQGT